MNYPISPWVREAQIISSDGKAIARFHQGTEVAMGAPTLGSLSVITSKEEIKISDHAASSMVWSHDSNYLAFSEWTKRKRQNLCVFNLIDRSMARVPGEFSVLEFHGFSEQGISAIDSPIHRPRHFTIPNPHRMKKGGQGN